MGKEKKKKKELPDPLDTTMSLGDHLEELRARLLLAILGLLIGSVVCLFFGKRIIGFIQGPFDRIMKGYAQEKVEEFRAPWTYLSDTFFANMLLAIESDPNAPAIDPNAVTYARKIYADTVVTLADDPNYTEAVAELHSSASGRLIVIAPADAFIGFMKVSLIAGLILSSPWVFYQLWMFVAAGLYENERRYVRIAVPFSTGLFVIGALFFLIIVAPLSLRFFLAFGQYIGVYSTWTFQKYISFVTMCMLVFGLGFQTPIAIFVLNRTGLVSIAALKSSRKYVIVAMFALAAIATPPDVVSQITLAIPLYALFELGILLSWLAERKKMMKEAAEVGSPSDSDSESEAGPESD
ncbi:MAG: twin-arginine translocase subunit TatC [Planctomycetota bacterium]|jgi:sec-independent protein translocase protein TatC